MTKLRVPHIAALGLSGGLITAAVHGEWPIVFFCMLALLAVVLLDMI